MIEEKITFMYEFPELEFGLEKEISQKWISEAILEEGKTIGPLNFLFTSDAYLLDINQKYLNHDFFTDIITFNYVVGEIISGDIVISVERVKENAEKYRIPFDQELQRVMIHGVLHLIGYDDQTPADQQKMRQKEDYFLTLHPSK